MQNVTTKLHTPHAPKLQQLSQTKVFQWTLGMVMLVSVIAAPDNPGMQGVAVKAFQVMAGVLAGILVMYSRFSFRPKDIARFLGVGAHLAVLMYFFSSLITFYFVSPEQELRHLETPILLQIVAFVLLYFVVASHFRQSEDQIWIMRCLVQFSGFAAILGLLTIDITDTSRPTFILFGNSQLFGGLLMLLLPITLMAAITEQEMKPKVTALICAGLTFVSLLVTGLRSAWIGSGIMLLALMAFSQVKPRRPGPRRTFRTNQLLPLLIILVCSLFAALQGDALAVIGMRLDAKNGKHSLAIRQRQWFAAEQLVILKPVFGQGLGTFPAMQQVYSKVGRPAEAVLQTQPALSEMAHSFWLQMAAEQGLVGVGMFVCILLSLLVAGLRFLKQGQDGPRRALLIACMAAVVAFTVDGLSNPAWQFAQISMYLWLMIGLGVACAQRPPTEQRS